jgi:hypothetical protein
MTASMSESALRLIPRHAGYTKRLIRAFYDRQRDALHQKQPPILLECLDRKPNEKRADQLTSHPSQYADAFQDHLGTGHCVAADGAQSVHGAAGRLIFSAAAITDYFDGYLARRYGLVSNLGKVMDPVADKLLVSCSLIMLTALGWMPAWIACIIIGRELAVTGLRNIIAQNKTGCVRIQPGQIQNRFPDCGHYPADVSLSGIWIRLSRRWHVLSLGRLGLHALVGSRLLPPLQKVASRLKFSVDIETINL